MPPAGAHGGPSGSRVVPPAAEGSEQVPELLLLHGLPLGPPGRPSFPLFTVKVSFTKTQGLLFSSLLLVYSWVLPLPLALSSIKAMELKALPVEAQKAGVNEGPESKRKKQTGAGEDILHPQVCLAVRLPLPHGLPASSRLRLRLPPSCEVTL